MRKQIILVLLLTVCLFTLTGCFDAKSIEEYSYAIAIAIDSSTSAKLKLSVQIANSSESSGGTSSQSTKSSIISVDCDDIPSGINIINNYSSKKLNLAHCTVIVLSEEIAKAGIESYVNTLSNNLEIRPSANIIISKSDAVNFLSAAENSGEEFSSRYYEYILNSSDYTGFTTRTTFSKFISDFKNTNKSPIAIYADVTNKNIQSTGLAVFKDDKYINNISSLDTIIYLILSNKLKYAIISIDGINDSGSMLPIEISLNGNTNIDVNLVNDSPFIEININLKAQLLDNKLESTSNNSDSNNMELIQERLNKYIEQNATAFLYKLSKEYNTDIVGFGDMLKHKYLTTEEFENVHWSKLFKTSTFKVDVNSNII